MAVDPSAISLNNPTGAGEIWKTPCALVGTGTPICTGWLLLLPWLARNRRTVAPGIGLLLLSKITPLMVVLAGSPGAFAEAANAAADVWFPSKFASMTLLS